MYSRPKVHSCIPRRPCPKLRMTCHSTHRPSTSSACLAMPCNQRNFESADCAESAISQPLHRYCNGHCRYIPARDRQLHLSRDAVVPPTHAPRRKRAGGEPEPPDDSRRRTAPLQLPWAPPGNCKPSASRLAAASITSGSTSSDEEREEHKLGEDRAADRRGDARDVGADDGDGARRPRGSAQQQIERRAA